MDKRELMETYKAFADDYNKGMDKVSLCVAYGIHINEYEEFVNFLKREGYSLYPRRSGKFKSAHVIDFQIFGDDMQFVEIELDPGETVVAEAGTMMYMGGGIQMETIFGDGSPGSQGVMDKIFGAGKRILVGESLFMTAFTNSGQGKQKAAFGAPFPGKIVAVDLSETGGEIICQKDAFLCAAKGVAIEIAFQKKLGVGLFGGEGFILQRLVGDGYAFIHAGGSIIEKELASGELMRIDTGCIAAMQSGVKYDIEFVGGIKSALFGGEGLFFATLKGPGKVWLQSLPFSRLADRIIASAPSMQGQRRGEGSILGTIGGMLDGDNRF